MHSNHHRTHNRPAHHDGGLEGGWLAYLDAMDYAGIRVVGLLKSAITRVSTAARSASARFMLT